MTDRQPGAPGQYILTVDASVAQNILTGQPVTVTLTRDDQPLVEGTPYNKAAVLPDDLAAMVCPSVLDPTPADAFFGLLTKRTEVTLLAANWENNLQTVTVSGVTADETQTDVFASANTEDENFAAYNDSGVRLYKQLDGKVTFKCEQPPEIDLIVNVAVRV